MYMYIYIYIYIHTIERERSTYTYTYYYIRSAGRGLPRSRAEDFREPLVNRPRGRRMLATCCGLALHH